MLRLLCALQLELGRHAVQEVAHHTPEKPDFLIVQAVRFRGAVLQVGLRVILKLEPRLWLICTATDQTHESVYFFIFFVVAILAKQKLLPSGASILKTISS